MKRRTKISLLCLLAVMCCIFSLAACGFPSNRHYAEKVEAVKATCTEDGNIEYWYCADCGGYFSDEECKDVITKADTITPAAHSYGDGVVTTAATCTAEGVMTYTCTECGETKTESIKKTAHTAAKVEAVKATCTSVGNTEYWYCTECGGYFADEACKTAIALADTVTAMIDHSYDDGAVTTAATCVKDGVKTYTCTTCGATKTEVLPAAHTATKVEAVKATCTSVGNTEYWYCAACGGYFADEDCKTEITKADTITAIIDHDYAQKVATENYLATSATCASAATYYYSCTMCGKKGTETFASGNKDLTNHVGETEVRNTKASTCSAEGYTGDTYCKTCNTKLAEGNAIAKIEHTEGEWAVVKAASCLQAGTKHVLCTECGEELLTVEIPATGHSGGTATCTTLAVCDTCGASYGELDPDNHASTETKWTTGNATHTGYYACCGILKTEAQAHTFENGACAVCGYGCKHTGGTATCTTLAVCDTCGVSYGEVNANNHTEGTWTVDVAASCTSAGSKHNSCAECATILKIETIAATGHTEVDVVGTAATCEETGLTDGKKCSVCDVVLTAQTVIPATGHSGGTATCTEKAKCATCGAYYGELAAHEYTVLKYDSENHWYKCANCEATSGTAAHTGGTATCKSKAVCSTCSQEYGELNANHHTEDAEWVTTSTTHEYKYLCCGTVVIAATAHTLDETSDICTVCGYGCNHTVGTAATCIHQAICDLCGHEYGSVDLTNHVGETEVRNAKSATCTKEGYTGDTYCTSCNTLISSGTATEATGHTDGEWTITVEAACTHAGSRHKLCTVCGAETAVEAIEQLAHTEKLHNVIEATCTTEGYTGDKICSVCNTLIESGTAIDKTAHTYDDGIVTAATCTATGYTTYTCKTCGDSYTDNETAATGHTEKTINAKTATCTAEGYTGDKICSVCSTLIESGTAIDKTAHTETTVNAKTATCTAEGYTGDKICSVCNTLIESGTTIDKTAHTEETINAKTATCSEAGYTGDKICSVCNTLIESGTTIDKTAHTASDWIVDVAATADAAGSKHTECTVCGTILEIQTVPVTGHNYTTVVTAPTCTGVGYTTYTCSDCGDTYTADITPATGHTESDWIVDVATTCVNAGSKHTECTVCGTVLNITTEAALGGAHAYKKTVTAATCGDDGYTTYTCVNCGYSYTADAVAATGEHSYGQSFETDETYHWWICTVCGEEFDKAEHTPVETEAQEATYSYEGMTAGTWCEYCNYVFTGCETVPKLTVKLGITGFTNSCFDLYNESMKINYGGSGGVTKETLDLYSLIGESAQFTESVTSWKLTDENGKEVTSAVTLALGANLFTLTVTDGTNSASYEVAVTRRELRNYSILYYLETETGEIELKEVSGLEEDSTYNVDSYAPDLSSYGYKFLGWKYIDGTAVSGEITLYNGFTCYFYAITEGCAYTATLSVEDGVTVSATEVTVTYGETYYIPVPAKEGATFLGWYCGETKLTDNTGNSLAGWSYTANKTLTASWSDKYYIVIVHGGGTEAEAPITIGYTYGESVTLSALEFDTDGYTFLGWYDGSGALVTADKEFSFTMPAENLVYIAKWTYYTLTTKVDDSDYDAICGGIDTPYTDEKIVAGTEVTLIVTQLGGYSFLGWYDEDGTRVSDEIYYTFYMPYSSLTYTAKWTVYTLTTKTEYIGVTEEEAGSLSSGSVYDAAIFSKGDYITLTATVNDGYTFLGWYFDEGEDQYGISILKSFVYEMRGRGDSIITAKWTKYTYTVAVDVDLTNAKDTEGNALTESDFVTLQNGVMASAGSTVSLVANEYAAYTFLGWFIGDEKTPVSTDLQYGYTMPYENVTITAKYSLNKGLEDFEFTTDAAAVTLTAVKDTTVTELYIDGCVTTITDGIFSGCTALTSITVAEDNANYSSLTGILYNKAQSEFVHIPAALSGDITIGSGITAISDKQFQNYTAITSVDFSNVTSIGQYAFNGCSAITSVDLKNVTSVGYYAFGDCTALTSAKVDKVTSLGQSAFIRCSSLTSVTLSEDLTILIAEVFNGCTKLESIIIPDSVTEIQVSAFINDSSLKSIVIGSGVTTIANWAFAKCSGLETVYYKGTAAEWANVEIKNVSSGAYHNDYLLAATVYYYSEETPTDTENTYWHYVNGVPTVWES